MTPDQLFSLLGKLITAGGGGAVVAFGLFRFFGKSWIEHELAKDLETVKSEISVLAARKLKLHDKEYIVFPELWSKLNKAIASLQRAIVAFKQMPDLIRMPDAVLEDWIRRSDLSEAETNFLTKESDKTSAYSRILDLRFLQEAHSDFVDFHEHVQAHSIFLEPELKDKFRRIDDLIWKSWINRKLDFDDPEIYAASNLRGEAWKIYEDDIKPLMSDVEMLVQTRLFPAHNPTRNSATK